MSIVPAGPDRRHAVVSTSPSLRESMEMNTAAEGDIIRRVQSGDLDAYEELLLRQGHAKRLRAWLATRAPGQEVADELAQEAFVVAFQRIGKFQAGTDFGAWLRGVAFQLLRQARKRFAVRERQRASWIAESMARMDGPSPQADALIEHLEHCLERVPIHLRRLLNQRYHDEMTVTDMAAAAGQSPEWVRTTLYRTRQQLRECIDGRQRAASQPSNPIPRL
jgi:RNA polymerase sigma-70 factor, ECF subfamily